MGKFSLSFVASLLAFSGALTRNVEAGDLQIIGNLGVASNVTAAAVTLGGETRTNWPGGTSVTALDLGFTPDLSSTAARYYSIILITQSS